MSLYATARTVLAIALGATAGALCRYGLGEWLSSVVEEVFPLGTLVVNLSGCFAMGIVVTLPRLQPIFVRYPTTRLVLTTGFLGSYTTFSSYELDTVNLLNHDLAFGLLYWAGTPILGLLCLQLGMRMAIAQPPAQQTKE